MLIESPVPEGAPLAIRCHGLDGRHCDAYLFLPPKRLKGLSCIHKALREEGWGLGVAGDPVLLRVPASAEHPEGVQLTPLCASCLRDLFQRINTEG